MTSSLQQPDWIKEGREKLLHLFSPGCGWGYFQEGAPCTEPTALACLALRAAQPAGQNDSPAADAAAQWLASIQQPNGAVGVSKTVRTPEWPTPYAILVWSGKGKYAENTKNAIGWLLTQKGMTLEDEGDIFGHDTTITGWPWVSGTHSWVEPTALAVMALRRNGLQDHARTQEGLRLIQDRCISAGGWNYGNNTVYGTTLRPQPAVTGIALLALNGIQGIDPIVDSACNYLESTVPRLRAPQSLCWALLGLTAWERRPAASEDWLEEIYRLVVKKSERAPQLAYLLLAASSQSLGLLGIQSVTTGGSA